ncbi:hypothetical protein [Vagococcus silagei]|uniref:Uncharacterized protein n=1 Tax=Vagococcus silagei TaxID=2508885 RepID=A0A4V3TV74_9ENTE|nr:hypothetical protein [Vagococcus silagei]THB61719.1 hypothetical protein ESZ54_03475 [Vagococcus silagei]
MRKTSTEANKKWQAKNPKYSNYLKKRSDCRNFLKKWANQDDLDEMRKLIRERDFAIQNGTALNVTVKKQE